MIRFDYLHDALPDVIVQIRAARLPRPLHAAAGALLMLLCATAAAAGIEHLRIRGALAIEARAQARFDRSRAALERSRLAWRELDTLIAQDERLREIRLSGPRLAARIARTANALPKKAWLERIAWSDGAPALKGRAENLAVLSDAVTRLVRAGGASAPRTIRITRDDRDRSGKLAFDIELEKR